MSGDFSSFPQHLIPRGGGPGHLCPIVNPTNGGMDPAWLRFFMSLFKRTGGSGGGSTFNSGDCKVFAGGTLPDGWLVCDGSAVSRTQYSDLFSAISTVWGVGDGTTTFNLPDMRGKMALGVSGSHALGTSGGAETTTLATPNLPSHNHGVTDPGHTHTFTGVAHGHGVTDPGHVHTSVAASSTNTAGAAAGTSVAGNTGSAVTGVTVNNTTATGTLSSDATGVTTQTTGAGTAFSTISPFAAVQWLIKT